ncbi:MULTISPECIES: maltodextrose utilization protein MalA [unclassified Enterococcus]|uniref:maltodextrose utilization protein MalA n=1 Tax=unclassified Enterococcus TaxID=2608891 RepID=UPI0013EDDC10|nr:MULTISPECIES: maltodextrose utilization protein MalA [unclassified Enterococcus]
MQPFPLNYFASLSTPVRLFSGRKQLSWPKFCLIFLFLVSLMVMPVTLYYSHQLDSIPIEQFLSVDRLIDQKGVEQFAKIQVIDGQTQEEKRILADNADLVIGVDLSKGEQKKRDAFINFEKKQWTIQQKEGEDVRRYTMNYHPSFIPSSVTSPEQFASFLEKEFYASNRPMIILSYSLSFGILLFLMTALLLFGAAFFLWLTRKSRFSSIRSFKESAVLMLNILGVGSIIATIFGLIHFDLVMMLGIQSVISVLLLLWIFAKTGFKDERIS